MAAWTDTNEHDPGLTVLEVLAWAVGALAFTLGVYTYLKLRNGHRRCREPS